MQSLFKGILIIIFLSVGVNTYGYFSQGDANTLSLVLTGTPLAKDFEIVCNGYYTINSAHSRFTGASTDSVISLTIDGKVATTSKTVTTQSLIWNFDDKPSCEQGEVLTARFERVSGTNSLSMRRVDRNFFSGYSSDVYEDIPISARFDESDPDYSQYFVGMSFDYIPTYIQTISTGSSSGTMATSTVIISNNDQLIQFFLLFCIFLMVIFSIVTLTKPFYARK